MSFHAASRDRFLTALETDLRTVEACYTLVGRAGQFVPSEDTDYCPWCNNGRMETAYADEFDERGEWAGENYYQAPCRACVLGEQAPRGIWPRGAVDRV